MKKRHTIYLLSILIPLFAFITSDSTALLDLKDNEGTQALLVDAEGGILSGAPFTFCDSPYVQFWRPVIKDIGHNWLVAMNNGVYGKTLRVKGGDTSAPVPVFQVEAFNGCEEHSRFVVNANGTVGIGTPNNQSTHYKLAVEGNIGCRNLKVTTVTGWPDYVFADQYHLKPLSEVEAFVQEHQHLPEVPSEQEINAEGLDVAEMLKKQLQKIEELTLYTIAQQKQIDALTRQLNGE